MKVMTYNIHSCIDQNKKSSLDRVSRLIKDEQIAIAGLNEIESFSPRTRFVNQPKKLASARQMAFCFGPAIKLGPIGFFGNALLSRYPILNHHNLRLPGAGREPRCCLLVRLRIPEGILTVISTHLGLNRKQREEQIAKLTEIIQGEKDSVVLMGDFNCFEEELKPIHGLLKDIGQDFGPKPTYPTDSPAHRIDYIFVSKGVTCRGLHVPFIDTSDHLPVIAELVIER